MTASARRFGLDPAFWRGTRVLLTGHTGFKGGWASLWLDRMGAEVTGLALAARTPSLFQLARVGNAVSSHLVDIRDGASVSRVVTEASPQLVLHLAAQPLVRQALADPVETIATNVLGTANLLQALRAAPDLKAVLVVTSDKVYANAEGGHLHTESDRLGGPDPYSASKAAVELVTSAMAQSFLANAGVVVATARAGNVIGGGDFAADRLVPDTVRAVITGVPLVLRHPDATRPWQHVLDCIAGYFSYLAAIGRGERVPLTLNFGPQVRACTTAAHVATAMFNAMGTEQIWQYEPQPGSMESPALALDSCLAQEVLGWTERLVGEHMIAATAEWYRAWALGKDMHAMTLRQIEAFEAMQ